MYLKSHLVKVLTLAGFLFLMIAFVAYRSGLFAGNFNAQSKMGLTPAPGYDTIKKPVKDTLKQTVIFPGSKSARVIEVTPDWAKPDSSKVFSKDSKDLKKRFDTVRIKSEKSILSSSKSGKIFIQEKDTARKKKN